MDWQPIETCPNASRVVMFCDERNNIWTDGAWDRSDCATGFYATHWRPLPAPSAIDQARGKGGCRMKREDVEALLVAAQGAGPADPVFGEELFGVEAPILAALCRRWLAVDGAQIREVEEEMHGLVIRAYPLKKCQRVRIVPEQGEWE